MTTTLPGQVSFATVVPPIMVFLAKHPLVDQYELSSLRDLVCAAAPLSEQLENEVRTRLNNDKLNFRQGILHFHIHFLCLISYVLKDRF